MSYQKCATCRYYVGACCRRHTPQFVAGCADTGMWPHIDAYGEPNAGCGDGEPRDSEPATSTSDATEVAAWRAMFAAARYINYINGCYWVGASSHDRPATTYDSPEAAVVAWYVERERQAKR